MTTKEKFILANLHHIWIDNQNNTAWIRIDKDILEYAGRTFRKATEYDVQLVIDRCGPVGELKRLLGECD